MALTSEEVKIRMGMDSTALRAGMASSSQFVEKSLKAVSSKAVSLLKANLYLAVLDLFAQIVPSAEEFWGRIYGTDPDSMAKHQQALENIRKVKDALLTDQERLAKAERDARLKNADENGKVAILEGEKEANAKIIANKKKAISDAKYDLEFTKGTKAVEARNEIILKMAASQRELVNAQIRQLEIEQALNDARDAASKANPVTPIPRFDPSKVPMPEDFVRPSMSPKEAQADRLQGLANAIDGIPGRQNEAANLRKMADNILGMRTVLEDNVLKVIIKGVDE